MRSSKKINSVRELASGRGLESCLSSKETYFVSQQSVRCFSNGINLFLSGIIAIILTGQVFAEDVFAPLKKVSSVKDSFLTGFVYPEGAGRNPFEVLIDSQGMINIRLVRQEKDLILNGIIYDNDESERLAIINNTVLKPGDYIGFYRIKEIMLSGVVLVKEGKELIIKMGGGNEK